MFSKSFLLLAIVVFTSCTHSVHLVNVGDFKPYQKQTSGKKIEARAEQTVFLGFTLETEYVNIAKRDLEKQCTDGTIQGPVTRLSTSHGFLSWTNKVYIQAVCISKQ